MNSEDAVKSFHRAIIDVARAEMGRDLTAKERQFVVSRGGFIALEMILDSVSFAVDASEIERYLNSDSA